MRVLEFGDTLRMVQWECGVEVSHFLYRPIFSISTPRVEPRLRPHHHIVALPFKTLYKAFIRCQVND
jgi:hypothetical protein